MAFTPAKPVTSPQETLHQHLEKTVRRHSASVYQKPIAVHTQNAFYKAYRYWHEHDFASVFLDSACGTGESSRQLATVNPNTLVIGLDQSDKRLAHSDNNVLPKNCLLLRCDCTDFWRLAAEQQWRFQYHSLYYPNPYPKPDDLKKRWHGHPAFTALLAISERIELRTNWKIYAEEFQFALQILGEVGANLTQYRVDVAITAFERKYQKSGHQIWQVVS